MILQYFVKYPYFKELYYVHFYFFEIKINKKTNEILITSISTRIILKFDQ
jgi:hypothetical protein